MKNLELKGSQFIELNERETKEIDGGFLSLLVFGAASKLFVSGVVVGALLRCCKKNRSNPDPTIP